jgi:hypothetical protein
VPPVSGPEASVELPAPPASTGTRADPAETRAFEELLASLRETRPKDDLSPIEKAYHFASQ